MEIGTDLPVWLTWLAASAVGVVGAAAIAALAHIFDAVLDLDPH